MRYLIKFSYDGSNFYGYQKQPGKRTVEGELERALYDINNHTVTRIYSSGRTDRGVHAKGQTAHFDLDISITLYKLKCALNSLLPDDIHVIEAINVDNDFHARFMVKNKTYKYYLNMGEYNPVDRNSIHQYNKELNIEKMSTAIKDLIGTHDFKIFTSKEVVKDNYTRTIYEANIEKKDNLLIFKFTGNGFMKYQVRNMVGTLIKIGKGKLESGTIKKLLNNEAPEKYIFTAKPEGLYLEEVSYK
ncbi:MAG: tRNA pseudouridine(38-40) synthase TruA [Bacilli bacterium]|nr:tRNA pseudouridine(38-40) synthase TruA [Bacilli bacterium]